MAGWSIENTGREQRGSAENKSVPFFEADPRLEKAAAGRQEPAGGDQGWAGEGGVLKLRG